MCNNECPERSLFPHQCRGTTLLRTQGRRHAQATVSGILRVLGLRTRCRILMSRIYHALLYSTLLYSTLLYSTLLYSTIYAAFGALSVSQSRAQGSPAAPVARCGSNRGCRRWRGAQHSSVSRRVPRPILAYPFHLSLSLSLSLSLCFSLYIYVYIYIYTHVCAFIYVYNSSRLAANIPRLGIKLLHDGYMQIQVPRSMT